MCLSTQAARCWSGRRRGRRPERIGRVGLINDDSTPVGRVHLGVVHLYELERPAVTPREEGLADAEFVPLDVVDDRRGQFETWSQICIDAFLRPAQDELPLA